MSERLERFLDAQDAPTGGVADALAEINSGRKRGHWIWYVLPQAAGLGRSPASALYAIESRNEGIAYVNHPVLRRRLLEMIAAVGAQLEHGVPLATLMGSEIDAVKLVSSLTLFRAVDDEIATAADPVLAAAEAQGYPPCTYTLEWLARGMERGRQDG